MNRPNRRITYLPALVLMIVSYSAGCAHYPVNQPLKQVDPQSGYRGKYMGTPGNSENLLLYPTFSGGGTRAAALSYGVLEELRKTEVVIDGKRRRLVDEIDGISSVSGGSFTAGYYGLFGDRIFEDFENKFLKKNIQGALTARTLFNPINWFRFYSDTFDRSDLAAEYYDEYVFEGGTFGDRAGRLCVVFPTSDWEDFVQLGITEIRQYGAGSIQVLRRLRAMLENLIEAVPPDRRPLLREQLNLLDRTVKNHFPEPDEQALGKMADYQGIGGSPSSRRENAGIKA